MAQPLSSDAAPNRSDWLEASGLAHIVKTLGLAVQPTKLGLGLAAILLTIGYGLLLDAVWKGTSSGVEGTAVARYVKAHATGEPFAETEGSYGVFEVWADHQRRCTLGLLGTSIPGTSIAAQTAVGAFVESYGQTSPIDNVANMVLGAWWMLRYHLLFFILFGAGAVLIWSAAGGVICRIAALQVASDETPGFKEAWRFTREKLFGGFFLAPCIPLIFAAVTIVLMVLGGMLLSIPLVGDLLGGGAFGLAILGGIVITLLLIGLIIGGSLLWPAVAVEGSDAFDAFSRSLSYPLTRPWKAALYAVISVVYIAICWMAANLVAYFSLHLTRAIVGFGTSPFGWWGRGETGDLPNKLERIWPLGHPGSLFAQPTWSELSWNEYISAGLITLHMIVVVGLLWAFLMAFYFSASTAVYYLLRRDVDATDMDDVYMPPDEDSTQVGETPVRESSPSAAGKKDKDAAADKGGSDSGEADHGDETP